MPNAKTGADSLKKRQCLFADITERIGCTKILPGIVVIQAMNDLQSSAWYKKSKNITFDTTANATLSKAFHSSLIFVLENSLL
jgi:hypothetical protein